MQDNVMSSGTLHDKIKYRNVIYSDKNWCANGMMI